MPSFSISSSVLTIAILLILARPAHAFGAGNIASVARIEGLNWRHGDIEDTLLTLVMSRAAGGKKFDKMNVARVYFGNWLRDYSQAIDVGTVKYVSAEAIRILLWVLGFMTFGYGTKEFEVTSERLGCYRPEDHIDNPKDYADNIDATQYDTRLRGPVDERVELAIDPRTGLKNFIANENVGIMTSALHVRKLFGRSIQLGRSYARSRNKDELYEALRLLGTGLHCLEDYSAHSNYSELALIEMGERDVFPHVGRQTQIRLQGAQHPVYPVITGTFGGVDFLHSVMGEFDDKATQSEIQNLEGTMQNSGQANTSVLQELLSSVPEGLFGGKDQAGKVSELQTNAAAAQMSQMRVSPRQPEAFTRQMQGVAKQIYPIIEWHDEVMKSITEAIEKIPVLPDLIENIENEINIFVFSLLAPFVVPIINQIKTELNTGSSEIIQSSKDKQLIVFHDDHSSDPTHSMLAKDHFSNILNEVAGKIASQVLKWVVPQLMQCWDDERVDPDRTITRIINGVFHHPALRNQGEDGAVDGRRLMFGVVEGWWRSKQPYEQQELRQQLSRDGVMNGQNHKEGVHDTGHGCGKPLGMAKSTGASSGTAAGALMGGISEALGGGQYGSGVGFGGGSGGNSGLGKFAGEAVGGGAVGGIVGALAGGLGGSLLGGVFGGDEKPKPQAYVNQGYTPQGGYQQQYTEVAHGGNQYAQAQYSETQLPGGGRQTDYQRFQQIGDGRGAGFEERTQIQPSYGGGYEQTNERIYRQPGGEVDTETWREGQTADGRRYHEARAHEEHSDSDDSGRKKHGKHHKKHYDSDDENDRPQQYQPPGGFGGGYGEPPRERYEERREEFGGRGGFGGGFQEAPRERFEEPTRQEYGGGGGFGGGYREPPRQEYGGNEAGWGEREREQEEYREEVAEEREEEREEEYREERREEGGGGWFS
ncbi:Het-C-domain-containing protein [Hyaloscypha bicolor E]|uniref:Het-C-domain-containing protein n=1 Tax=Hyaloscypha bicolor E TaxID=1095630 RepID=A0A2J6TEI5_9HELO|nr:Het-C-domain-containing protein [Hyaloscypha bicolor E]PMD61368.1 Het-C-domain-containing protein [Hyaloscypha bicolor E]